MIIGLDINSKKLICSECGSIIFSAYNRYDKLDKILCENCSKKALVCDICGVPSALLDKLGDLKVCPSCLSKKDACGCCGKHLDDNNIGYIKGVPEFFCKECISKNENKCSCCGKPTKNKNELIKTSTNEFVCSTCYKTHIYDLSIAKNVIENISKILYSKFQLELPTIPLYLVSEVELKYLRKMKSRNLIINENKNGLSAYDGKIPSIYINYGLSLPKFISTLAKEYIISWMSLKNKIKIYNNFDKSFAQWITNKLLFLLGYQKERKDSLIEYALENGRSGIMKLNTIEKRKGINGVLDFTLSRDRKSIAG